MKIRERIGTVDFSRNLGEARADEISDVDVVRACGMVGMAMPLGMSLWRLKVSGDTREYPRVIEGLVELVSGRGVAASAAVRLVNEVLAHHLDDMCKPCDGRGHDVVPGTPMLSDVACVFCDGQGRVQLKSEEPRAHWLLEQIARMEREVAAAVMRKLASEMEF
jgi:hypothetical protein